MTATSGSSSVTGKTNPLGFFSLKLGPRIVNEPAVLTFEDPEYKTLELVANKPGNQLYIANMQLRQPASENNLTNRAGAPGRTVGIRNVRVRYTSKNESLVGVGSLAKQFAALNVGNVPCRAQPPCSPDGKWKAAKTTLPLDAGEGNQFRNVRVSCVAGPCAFTKIEPERIAEPARKISISVLNWSDTTEFLIEADVERTMVTDLVQYSYPFIVGQTMSFALPSSSEGPSVEADLDGQYIVFPLGPAVSLSQATCSVDVSSDGIKTYRCQLKLGYRFED